MAGPENTTSREYTDVVNRLPERRSLEQKEKSKPPESEQDTRLKMGLGVLLGDLQGKMTGQATEWKTRLQTMKEKEGSLNSLSPENLWGYSGVMNGVKDSMRAGEMKFDTAKTNSALKLDIVEAYSELLNRRLIALPRLEYMLQSGQRWEDIRNDASMRQFLITPEGEYIIALARGENPKDVEATYTLAKARELKKSIPKSELYAQSLYEKLKGTKYESIANQEKMNIAETIWKQYLSEIGNDLLGTDSLAVMAISGPVGGSLAKAIKGERAVTMSQNSINVVNKNGYTKALIPGVQLFEKKATDTVMMQLGKGALNIGMDATKIVTYTETVRQLGGNDAAKYASYIFLFMPGAKMAFERDMLARPTSHITSENILSWALAKIGPERLKQSLQSQEIGAVASMGQGVTRGAEQAVQEMQQLAKVPGVQQVTTAVKSNIARIVGSRDTPSSLRYQIGAAGDDVSKIKPFDKGEGKPIMEEMKSTMEEIKPSELKLEKKELGFDITKNPVYKEYSFLEKYADVLGDLKPSDILSDMGTQALIVKPKILQGVVAKIERPNATDKVKDELTLHSQAYTIWKIAHDAGVIPGNIYVPKISIPKGASEGIILIEQVQGQSLHTKSLIDKAYTKRKDAQPLNQTDKEVVSGLTDGEAKKWIMERYSISSDEARSVIDLYSVDHLGPYLFDRMNPTAKTDLTKALSYMQNQSPGINQIDIHPGNFMVTNDKKIYIIDWGRAVITNIPTP